MKKEIKQDYKRIFIENLNPEKINKPDGKKEKQAAKEKKYVAVFFAQSVICLIIICSIIIVKYANPKTFVSVSSVLNGLYENNVTLSDLNKLIDEKILGSGTLATFFNITPE